MKYNVRFKLAVTNQYTDYEIYITIMAVYKLTSISMDEINTTYFDIDI